MSYKDPLDPRARAARRKHYYANRDQYYARNKIQEEKVRKLILAAKDVPCMDCLIRYPSYVMDFDHRPGVEKLDSVSQMTKKTIKQVLAEIAKCDVVCANCHRERTHKRLKGE